MADSGLSKKTSSAPAIPSTIARGATISRGRASFEVATLPTAAVAATASSSYLPEGWKGTRNMMQKGVYQISEMGLSVLGNPLQVPWPIPSLDGVKTPITINDIKTGKVIGGTQTLDPQKGIEVRKVEVSLNGSGKCLLVAAWKTYGRDALKAASYELEALKVLQDSKNRNDNVVLPYNIYYNNGRLHVLMEYMDRGSVEDLLRIIGPLSCDVTAIIVRQVVLGLQFLHEKGLIHRNLKPSNLLINKKGQVKISDFCVCKYITRNTPGADTIGIGSHEYRPPESLASEKVSRTKHCDIWQIGVLTAHCLFGAFPLMSRRDFDNARQTNRVIKCLDDYLNKFDLAIRLEQKTVSLDYDLMISEASEWYRVHIDIPEGGARAFINPCLAIDPTRRPTCEQLLEYAFINIMAIRMDEGSLDSWLLEIQYKEKLNERRVTSDQVSGAIAALALNGATNVAPTPETPAASSRLPGK